MARALEVLLPSAEELEQALAAEFAGCEGDWADRVGAALVQIEVALRQHAGDCEAPGGMFAQEVDLTRPALVRQVGELRREHAELLRQAQALRADIQHVARAFDPAAEARGVASPVPEAAPAAGIPDFEALRRRGDELAAALRHHRELETDLVQESVTTDLGAGD
jgi:hypothetical protein